MRIAIIDRADMNPEQARVYDEANNSDGIVRGPYYAYIRLPKLFEASQNLRRYLFSGVLPARERQIANLVVARHWNAEYPWTAQVRVGLAAGLTQDTIDAINARKTPKLDDPRERAAHLVARELLEKTRLSDATYAAAEKALGLEQLVALVATIGSFSMTCLTANAFEVDAPSDAPTPLAK